MISLSKEVTLGIQGGGMKLYHGTSRSNVDAIKNDGFRDATGNYMLSIEITGVFFSNMPLDENEGACSDAYFVVDIPEDQIDYYELKEEGKRYREWCIPAALANTYFISRDTYTYVETTDLHDPVDWTKLT